MRVAIYIEDGVTQLVLTPEGDWEDGVCRKIAAEGEYDVTIRRGEFYANRGGWYRQGEANNSLILRADRRAVPEGE